MSKLFNKLVTMNNSYLRSTIAYAVYSIYPDGTKILLGSDIDFDKTSGGCNNSLNQYCIINGSLYYINTNKSLSRVGTLTNWQRVSSYTYAGTIYAIESGNLYSLSSTTATLIDSSGWTFCTTSENDGQALGIKNGYPYNINGVSGWTTALSTRSSVNNFISVNSELNHTWICLGLTSTGALYQNASWSYGQLTRYGTSNSYTRIGGLAGGTDYSQIFGISLDGGKIYSTNYNSSTWTPQTTRIGTSSNWLDITGWFRSGQYMGVGIKGDTKLYKIDNYSSEPSTVLDASNTGWSSLSGCASSLPSSFVGIKNNSLYVVNYSGTVTTVDTTKKWVKIFGSSETNKPCIAICEK